ncbi:hypothetical protein IKJ53_01030 [bacterium]|nr:hypothetical protein [bacterium]
MFILDFFRRRNTCSHAHVSPSVQYSYCPDCGELIENKWYITRCACCGIKEKAIIRNGEIMPEANFCHNCGGNEYIVEELEKINFVDINYAVLVKTVVPDDKIVEVTQSWEEKSANKQILLQLFQ